MSVPAPSFAAGPSRASYQEVSGDWRPAVASSSGRTASETAEPPTVGGPWGFDSVSEGRDGSSVHACVGHDRALSGGVDAVRAAHDPDQDLLVNGVEDAVLAWSPATLVSACRMSDLVSRSERISSVSIRDSWPSRARSTATGLPSLVIVIRPWVPDTSSMTWLSRAATAASDCVLMTSIAVNKRVQGRPIAIMGRVRHYGASHVHVGRAERDAG